MTKLYDIITAAEQAIDTYKHPDLAEFIEAVDPILSALGKYTIGHDHIESIRIGRDYIHITTSYSCRGCSNTNDSTIPMSIVEAENPVRAATERTLRAKLTKAIEELNYARNRIPNLEEISQAVALELATFLKSA